MHAGSLWGNLTKTDHSDVSETWDGSIKMDLKETGCEGVD